MGFGVVGGSVEVGFGVVGGSVEVGFGVVTHVPPPHAQQAMFAVTPA